MIEPLRTAIEGLGWHFSYARPDFHNLEQAASATDTTPFFFMDPTTRTPERSSDTGNLTGWVTYEGRYMILLKSQLDEVYDAQKGHDKTDGKWQKHIRPILEDIDPDTALMTQLEEALTCGGLEIKIVSQRIQEVVNYFSENMDGVLVTYKWRRYESN